jgi:hypothetical protein
MAYVDDAYHNMDDLKKLDLLNDDGSFHRCCCRW